MKIEPVKLTVKEALEQGYSRYSEQDDEYSKRIDQIDINNFPEHPVYLVDKDNSYPFTINAKSIEEWVIETLVGEQDEVSDPDCELSELAAAADFQKLADDINQRMSKIKYYDLTDIELIP